MAESRWRSGENVYIDLPWPYFRVKLKHLWVELSFRFSPQNKVWANGLISFKKIQAKHVPLPAYATLLSACLHLGQRAKCCSLHVTMLHCSSLHAALHYSVFEARVHWRSFSGENVSDSDRLWTCLGHFGQFNTDRIISICFALTKVAKASVVATVKYRCLTVLP